MPGTRRVRGVITVALTTGAMLVAPAVARAVVSAGVTNGTLVVTGDNGPQSITITDGGANLVVQGATQAGPTCAGAGPVTCPEAGITRISGVLATDRDIWDSETIALPTTVDLGPGLAIPFFVQSAQTGSGADTILGGPHEESDIDAGAGNDTIRTFGGNDGLVAGIFTGGLGSILGGPGADRIELGDGNDGSLSPPLFIDGGEGNDTYDLGAGNDQNVNELAINSGDDVLIAGPGDDGLQGFFLGAGADTTDGGSGDDNVTGGGPGADTVNGGPDSDQLRVDTDGASDALNGGSGDDLLSLEYISPGIADTGNDTLRGGVGRDFLQALIGPGFSIPALVSTDGTANDGFADSPQTANVMPDVEILNGTDGADVLRATTAFADLRGNRGDDQLIGGRAGDLLAGGAGTDSLSGGAGNDFMNGGEGDDALSGARGRDFLRGGTGADSLRGGAGTDTADWAQAVSAVSLTPGRGRNDGEAGERDNLGGDVENLIGSPFGDRIKGARKRSVISALGGDDTIIVADAARDIVACGSGDDSVKADRRDVVEVIGSERCETIRRPRRRR